MFETLLRTKLFLPRLRPNLVPRQRLIDQLNHGLQLGHKLTLISAPAGFGKTTLATDWANSFPLDATKESQIANKIAWLSLDDGDNEPARFLTYLVAALNQIEENENTIGKGALAMIQTPQRPSADLILTSLINDIAAIPANIILVLDDYHVIESSPVDKALIFLLEHLPPQLHLVIITRDDPNLPLARYRVRSQLTELRAGDLRFSYHEAAWFLNQVMDLDLSAQDIAALETRTEGWIAGLQLAALSMKGQTDIAGFIQSFTGSHYFVLDYLVEEVLQQQPASIQDFLLRTSVLKRLNGPLCEAILRTPSGTAQETLEYLERANLFIIPLDNERGWYRYHHLFADLLEHRLRQLVPDQIHELHRRASDWYAQIDLPSAAIHHALAAQDFERAADLAELAWPANSGSFQSIAWLSWLKALPDGLVHTRPVLCVAYAWANLNSGNLEAAETKLLEAERWLQPAVDINEQLEAPSTGMVIVDEKQFRSLPVSLTTARAYHAQAVGDISSTVIYAQKVFDLLPDNDHLNRMDAVALLGLAHWANGDLEAAYQTLSGGLTKMGSHDLIIGTFVLAEMKAALGQLNIAENTCLHALQLAADHGESMPLGTEDVHIGLSAIHRERGNLQAATQDLLTAENLGKQVELPDWQYRWCLAQARLKESLGDLDRALDLLSEAERLFVRTPLPEVRPIPALKARVLIAQGKLNEASDWVRDQNLSVDDNLSYLHEFEHITLARLLIAEHKVNHAKRDSLEAAALLERLLEAAENQRRMGSVIEILLLQAVAYEVQGSIMPALASLKRALTLAEPEAYFQLFVEEGAAMARLLYEALSRGIMSNYAGRLLAAFPALANEPTAPSKSKTPETSLIEPLTDREIEVLQLISEGLTNREIAARLFLSLHTVKVHTRNINGKLGVHNRAQAVISGKALGILPPI